MQFVVLFAVIIVAMAVAALVTYIVVKAPVWWPKLIDGLAKAPVEEWNGWRRGPMG